MSAILPSSTLCCPERFCSAPVSVAVPGPQGPPGPAGESPTGELAGWFDRDTLSEALLIPASATNHILIMLGSATANDGFGGIFDWDNDSNELHNYTDFGGSIINPTGNPGSGRWVRFI